MIETERPDHLRLWLESDLTGHQPEPAAPGTVTLDGGDPLWRALSRGVGVTGYDEADCLALVETWAPSRLPPVKTLTRDPNPDDLPVTASGAVTEWRGVWFLGGNIESGPVILGRTQPHIGAVARTDDQDPSSARPSRTIGRL